MSSSSVASGLCLDAPEAHTMRFRGQVVRRRTRSKQLAFFDVRRDVQFSSLQPKRRQEEGQVVSVIADAVHVMIVENGTELMAPGSIPKPGVTAFKTIRNGDEIDIIGEEVNRSDGSTVSNLRAFRIDILHRWSMQGLGLFEPYREKKTVSSVSTNSDQASGLCKFYLASGICFRHPCPFVHDNDAHKRREWEVSRRKQKTESSALPCDPFSAEQKKPKDQRAAVLANFLEGLFGRERLQRQGIVDVAGGKGALAFEMHLRQIPCLTVDPRPACLSKAAIKHYQTRGSTEPMLERFRLDLDQVCDLFDGEFLSRHPGRRAFLLGACCFVGLHPDQATNPIIEVANALRKPFVIVPCCVFAREFPDRRLCGDRDDLCAVDGCSNTGLPATDAWRHVESFTDLVRWIRRQAKVKASFLPVEGKNLVLVSEGPNLEVSQDEVFCG
ncbi:MAG: uncharacterized protein KVP18_003472 [Porospora cf. gigantea A]|uniref:uncharacterized protein n=1 Tax=Porospora cf. gigantea A TaxID=2853593 RepID=UPI00355AA7C3|nr:MAG: hypothetical protein KVP18_003472 [Porospora cf. gigantea A]